MMTIRPYRPADRSQLIAIHQRQSIHDGLPYLWNDPSDPLQVATIVAVDGGRVVGAASSRKIAEGRTFVDPIFGGHGSDGPVHRWMLLSKLIQAGARVCYDAGFREIMAATAPNARGYAARLVRELGFTVDERRRLYLDLEEKYGQKELARGRA